MEESNVVRVKILSIVCLHIMKLESPVLSEWEIRLIERTIGLKIKGESMMEYLGEEDKRRHLEGLIYIIYQFYKILHYLKLDE